MKFMMIAKLQQKKRRMFIMFINWLILQLSFFLCLNWLMHNDYLIYFKWHNCSSMLIEFKCKSKTRTWWKKKNSLIFTHFLVAILLSNHAIERNMIYDIIDVLNDTISTSLHFILFNFIQVHCRYHVQLNV